MPDDSDECDFETTFAPIAVYSYSTDAEIDDTHKKYKSAIESIKTQISILCLVDLVVSVNPALLREALASVKHRLVLYLDLFSELRVALVVCLVHLMPLVLTQVLQVAVFSVSLPNRQQPLVALVNQHKQLNQL